MNFTSNITIFIDILWHLSTSPCINGINLFFSLAKQISSDNKCKLYTKFLYKFNSFGLKQGFLDSGYLKLYLSKTKIFKW